MARHSGRIVNFTIKVDDGILIMAKHRALLEGRSLNRHLADAVEDYADGVLDAARRTMSAGHVFAVIEEHRRLRRRAKKARQAIPATWRSAVAPIAFSTERRDRDDEDG